MVAFIIFSIIFTANFLHFKVTPFSSYSSSFGFFFFLFCSVGLFDKGQLVISVV